MAASTSQSHRLHFLTKSQQVTFPFRKKRFVFLIIWDVFFKYLGLAGFFWYQDAHSELSVGKQLGTLQLNGLWPHAPSGGQPSSPSSRASTERLQLCRHHRFPESHTRPLFSVLKFWVWMSSKCSSSMLCPAVRFCISSFLLKVNLRDVWSPVSQWRRWRCAYSVAWISAPGVQCLREDIRYHRNRRDHGRLRCQEVHSMLPS